MLPLRSLIILTYKFGLIIYSELIFLYGMAHKDQDSLYEYPIIYSHCLEETFLPPTEVIFRLCQKSLGHMGVSLFHISQTVPKHFLSSLQYNRKSCNQIGLILNLFLFQQFWLLLLFFFKEGLRFFIYEY